MGAMCSSFKACLRGRSEILFTLSAMKPYDHDLLFDNTSANTRLGGADVLRMMEVGPLLPCCGKGTPESCDEAGVYGDTDLVEVRDVEACFSLLMDSAKLMRGLFFTRVAA